MPRLSRPKVPIFDKKFVKKIKTLLEKKQEELKARKAALAEEDPFAQADRLTANAPDDDSQEQEGHRRVEALREEIDKILHEVKTALSKIGVGTYGICEKCGKPIDKARLKALSTADTCIECELKERK